VRFPKKLRIATGAFCFFNTAEHKTGCRQLLPIAKVRQPLPLGIVALLALMAG